MPDLNLAIALDGVPFNTPSTGTDITDDVWVETPVTCNLGRDQARQQSPAKVGLLIFELNNTDRKYSPENVDSAYYPAFTPPVSVRLSSAGAAGEALEFVDGSSFNFIDGSLFESPDTPARVIFTGQLDNPTSSIEWGHRTVAASCLQMSGRLVGKRLTSLVYQDKTIDQLIGYLLDEAGWPTDDRLLDVSSVTLPFWWLDGEDAYAALSTLVNTDGAAAYFYEDGEGRIVFKNHMARLTETRSTVSQATYSANENIYTFNYQPNYKDVIVGAKVTQTVRAIQPLDLLWSYGQNLVLTANQEKKIQIRGSDPFINTAVPSPIGTNEVQVLTPSVVLTNGTFTATYKGQTTASLGYDETAAHIQSELEALSTIGSGNVICTGGPINTSPVYVYFRGALKEQAIDLITITTLLNVGSKPATINAVDMTDGPDTTWKIFPSAPLASGQFKIKNHLGNHTAFLGYNATAGQIQTAIENQPVIVPGDVAVSGGPINTSDTTIVFQGALSGSAIPLSITDASTLTTNTDPTATINVTRSVKGGGPDYVISAGDATFALDRDNGPSAVLTITAGVSGATITGLQVRAQQITVIRSQDVSYPVDLSTVTEGVILAPTIRAEIPLEDAESLVFSLYDRYHPNRPTIGLGTMMAQTNAHVDGELVRQVGDRVTITEPQTGVNAPYYIEQKQYVINSVANLFTAIYGLEKAM